MKGASGRAAASFWKRRPIETLSVLREVRTIRSPLRTDGRSAAREGRPRARSAGLSVRAAPDRRPVTVVLSVTTSPLWAW